MNSSATLYGKIPDTIGLGRLIRQVRREQGLTQEELSALVGIGPRLIGEIERGKATAEVGKVFQLLSGLGLTVAVHPRSINDVRE